MEDLYGKISAAVISGNVADIKALTDQALAKGTDAADILAKGLVPGMDYVGAQFRKGEMYVPEVLLSARAMQASMNTLRPLLAAAGGAMESPRGIQPGEVGARPAVGGACGHEAQSSRFHQVEPRRGAVPLCAEPYFCQQ